MNELKIKPTCKFVIMTLLVNIIVIILHHLNLGEAINDNLQLPDYDDYTSVYKPKQSLRERFLERKNKNKEIEDRIYLLNKYYPDTVYFDGVAHIEVNEELPTWKIINETEVDLKKIFAAEGAEYIYKRDHHWRTWKKVVFPGNVTRIVCYKCNSVVNATCKKCNSGFWNIEEKAPPCPLELFYVVNDQQICAANFTQLYNYKDECPILLNFADVMITCDNPIRTTYQIKRLFKLSKGLPSTICGEQDYCEISTYYRIYKDFILFRITNSSDDIVYSKIMKHGNKNYACIANCGRVDTNKNNVMDDKPLSFSLLPSHVNKRENEIEYMHNTTSKKNEKEKNKSNMAASPQINKNATVKKMLLIEYGKKIKITMESNKHELDKHKDVSLSTCSRLSKQVTTEDYEDNYRDYDYKDNKS